MGTSSSSGSITYTIKRVGMAIKVHDIGNVFLGNFPSIDLQILVRLLKTRRPG
jgi:hypothetical protein